MARLIDSNTIKKTHLAPLREEFSHLVTSGTAGQAIQKLLDDYSFDSVLDLGAGEGLHTKIFLNHGKKVLSMDLGDSIYSIKSDKSLPILKADYLNYNFSEKFDCIWCSHVLEHQPNVNTFLRKIHFDLKEGGILAITVPPLKDKIVGGHLSLWNAGLLIYNLVMAGFNCKRAKILRYGYNISCIIEKETISINGISYDSGDIDKLSAFFPANLKEGFNGDIYELDWY